MKTYDIINIGDSMMNNKGFTLVELLAVLSVLAVLMLLAVPNVIGVVQRDKNKTYVEDAKKLVTLAEYKIRSNPNLKPSNNGNTICFYLDYLDKTKELNEPPNGGVYDRYISYVQVVKTDDKIKYKVQLAEKKGGTTLGIAETDSDNLFDDNMSSLTKNSPQKQCDSNLGRYYWDRDDNPASKKKTDNSPEPNVYR